MVFVPKYYKGFDDKVFDVEEKEIHIRVLILQEGKTRDL